MTLYNKTAWRTENWIRIRGKIFMIQQRWELYRVETDKNYDGYGYADQQAFPADEWRVVSLEEQLSDKNKRELVEAMQDAE